MRPDDISFWTTMSHFGAIFFALAHWLYRQNYNYISIGGSGGPPPENFLKN